MIAESTSGPITEVDVIGKRPVNRSENAKGLRLPCGGRKQTAAACACAAAAAPPQTRVTRRPPPTGWCRSGEDGMAMAPQLAPDRSESRLFSLVTRWLSESWGGGGS